jgi:hypothetical protein
MRYALFHFLMACKKPFSRAARRRRMQVFLKLMKITGNERIIDLGGAPEFWDDCPIPLDITVVNLPGFNATRTPRTHHRMTVLVGDACNLSEAALGEYDIVFSNSVIEHVGDEAKQAAMAEEVRRLGRAYWVQTPSIWFPIEAHTNMPFWWFYPPALKQALISNWRRKLPDWTEMVVTTTVLMRGHLKKLFPDAKVWTEWKLGFVKSYVLYKPPSARPTASD